MIFKSPSSAEGFSTLNKRSYNLTSACSCMCNTYPMNGSFYLDSPGIIATPAFRNIGAMNFRNIPCCIFYKAFAFHDIGTLQPNHAAGCKPEPFFCRFFHKIFPFYPKLLAEREVFLYPYVSSGPFSLVNIFCFTVFDNYQ